MKTFAIALCLLVPSQFFGAEQAKRSSGSQNSTYVPIGIDDFDTNLEQLKQERNFIVSEAQRNEFMRLCDAAMKTFADNQRVSEIAKLKNEAKK